MRKKNKRVIDKDSLINELSKLIFRELDSGRPKTKSFAIIRRRWALVERQAETTLYEIVAKKADTAYVFSRDLFFKDSQ